MFECQPTRGRVTICRSGAFLGIAIFFVCAPFSQAQESQSQDVAEAARQQQARKAAPRNVPRHVYTDEDLKKEKILTPDDQAEVAARRQQQKQVPPIQTVEQKPDPAGQESQTESLGEVARRYRREKAEQQAEEASKKKYTPFEYELAHPTVASPKSNVAPAPVIRPNGPNIDLENSVPQPVAPRAHANLGGSSKGRISPFQPRPSLVPPLGLHVNPAPVQPLVVPAPRPMPVIPRAVEQGSNREVRAVQVQVGDSWWKLATQYLGSGSRWPELRQLNPDAGGSPDLLRAGITIRVPEEMHSRADSISRAGRNQVRVQQGDTLWSLARRYLGRGSAWTTLACLNPKIQNYQRIPVGSLLRLPNPDQLGACTYASEGLTD